MDKDTIIRMAREAGLERVVELRDDGTRTVELPHPDLLERFAALVAALAEPQRKPLTQEEIDALFNRLCHERSAWPDRRYRDFARWVERAHGIGGSNGS